MSVSAIIEYQSQKQRFHDDLKAKAKSHGEFVAAISMEALLSHDYVTLNKFMRDISQLDDIIYGVILSDNGNAVTSYLNKKNSYIDIAIKAVNKDKILSVIERVSRHNAVSSVKFPVMLDDIQIASIDIGVDLARLTDLAKSELIEQLATNAFIIVFLSICIYIVFRYNALHPIDRLIKGSIRVASGNLDEQVEVRSNDELGLLARSFNEMMLRLKKSIAETNDAMDMLRVLNKDLEARVQERTARLELAQKIAQMGHWDYDTEEKELHASNEIYNIIGIEPAKPLSNKQILKIIHPQDRHVLLSIFRRSVKTHKPFENEFRIVHPDGKIRVVSMTAESTQDQKTGIIRLFGILQDITERKAADRAAQKALIDKVNAESANRAKSAFLANMSHEMRTPLTAIIGFAELVLEKDLTNSTDNNEIKIIIENGKHLLQVINELLDVSKIESQTLEIDIIPTPIGELFTDIQSLMDMQARGKGLNFAFEYNYPLPVQINTDPTRIKQILLNLCSNGIKFTAKGSVSVIVDFNPKTEKLHFAVNDTGIGISETQLMRLFKPFAQADTSITRLYGGTGLGLYISKQLIEKLGGTISIQSIVGLGTRVEFDINTGTIDGSMLTSELIQSSPSIPSAPNYDDKFLLNGHVLVAEDNIHNQKLISNRIEKIGPQVTVTDNGKKAMELALANHFDLILMDMQMPVMDGVEATRHLRKSGYDGPIVALTANAMQEDRQLCISAGCDEFLTKPLNRKTFCRVLKSYLTDGQDEKIEGASEQPQELDQGVAELAANFIDELPLLMQEMEQLLLKRNWQQISEVSQQIKCLSGNYGYAEVSKQAAELENQLHLKNHQDIQNLVERTNGICQTAITDFNQRFRPEIKKTG